MGRKILLIGCGYRGSRLGVRLLRDGHSVYALTRSERNAETIASWGATPIIGDLCETADLQRLPLDISIVYHMMGNMRGGEEELRRLHVEGTRSLIHKYARAGLSRYIYESSSAVYGQTVGDWVDETSTCDPVSLMGTLRLEAEALLREAHESFGFPFLILRASSIYRPEGIVNAKIASGSYTVTTDPGKIMNHIYIEDYIEALALASVRGRVGQIYNLTDDNPHPAIDYFNAIADAMGVRHPRIDYSTPVDGCARLVRETNKKCSNEKLRKDFSYEFKFPTFREGIADSARRGWRESPLAADAQRI